MAYTIDRFFKMLDEQYIYDDLIVRLRRRKKGEQWTQFNEVLTFNSDIMDHEWLNDWDEGCDEIEVVGYVSIGDVVQRLYHNGKEVESRQYIDALSKMPPAVVEIAYLYASNVERFGVDVTEKWLTAAHNAHALEKAYMRGYREGCQDCAGTMHSYVDTDTQALKSSISIYNKEDTTK